MIPASKVTACLVTRGDVPMDQVVDSLPFERVLIYDNDPDLGVYGRYAAVAQAESSVCFVQDDDCVLDPEAFEMLLAAYEPGHVVCNLPQRFRDTGSYDDSALVGFGALFDRDLPERAFTRFALASHAHGAVAWGTDGIDRSFFDRECDSVFTMLTPRILVDAPYSDLPWASAPNRLWKQPEHNGERERMRKLVRQVRDA